MGGRGTVGLSSANNPGQAIAPSPGAGGSRNPHANVEGERVTFEPESSLKIGERPLEVRISRA